MPQIATKTTTGTLDADVTVESGGTIRVHCIFVSNNTGASITVNFKIGDGTGDPILTMSVLDKSTTPFTCKWLADRGLSVDSVSDPNAVVNIIHSAVGA